MCITCTRVLCTVRTNVSSPLGPPGSSVLAGVVALTHLWTQQFSDGQGKVATILGKVCNVYCDQILLLLHHVQLQLCVSAGCAVPVKFYCVQQPVWSS